MWIVGYCVVALLVVYCTHWIIKWRSPKCDGILPPGSMGLPFIGETLELITRSYSLDLHPFFKKRIQRYGSIFRTSVAGRPIVVSTDPEFNHYIIQQEGRLVEFWYMDTFSKLFDGGESRLNASGHIHKYIRSIALNHFGAESLKEKLLSQVGDIVNKTLCTWSSQASIEVKQAASAMTFDIGAKQMFGYDPEKSLENMGEMVTKLQAGLMSLPLNIPGTRYHNCLKIHKKIKTMLKDVLKERQTSPEMHRGDYLDQVISDMQKEKFLTEDFIVHLMLGILYAGSSTPAIALTLVFKFLAEHPPVLDELTAEHNAILKNRENLDSSLTWDEYKSMTFTHHVINESLRLGNIATGLLRRALEDIQVKGYTIPAGWTLMVLNSPLQLNPDTYKDPLTFNPWRWKDLDSYVISKNFMPFGGGMRQCAGAEYSKAFLATFIHVLVTKYRWTKVKGGRIARNPFIGFGDGIHIKFSKKHN